MSSTPPLLSETTPADTNDVPDAEATPEAVIAWAASHFSRIALSCSFGGPGGLVLGHMVSQWAPHIPLLFIDTNFLFPETYALRQVFAEQYGLRILDYSPKLTPQEQAFLHGDRLWERHPNACCAIRKVEPMQRALTQLDAWITALRRDQSPTRADVEIVETHFTNDGRSIKKINPLAYWTRQQVWDYLIEHNVPCNPLLQDGYKSLGCRFCTRRVDSQEEERAGRWPGSGKKECGLHTFTRQLVNRPTVRGLSEMGS